ncbi:Uncharacterised protein [Budvicia aquatica]|uniref:Uncharacterized protein n=1 Tax=Budvicia aquatica TaxID=82979 RepID=A0A484ZHG3_9GAMM|nr:Uncharacterised protein [Budvicia aquatica]
MLIIHKIHRVGPISDKESNIHKDDKVRSGMKCYFCSHCKKTFRLNLFTLLTESLGLLSPQNGKPNFAICYKGSSG